MYIIVHGYRKEQAEANSNLQIAEQEKSESEDAVKDAAKSLKKAEETLAITKKNLDSILKEKADLEAKSKALLVLNRIANSVKVSQFHKKC
jgi:hypothetical protein